MALAMALPSGHALALQAQPGMEFRAKRPGPDLPHGKALMGRQLLGFTLDSVQPGDALHRLGGYRTLVFLDQLVEFSSRMRHAARFNSPFKLEDAVIGLVAVSPPTRPTSL